MEEGSGFGCGRGVLGFQGRASSGAEGTQGLRAPALIEVVLGNGLGLGGVEGGSLIEVVGEPLLLNRLDPAPGSPREGPAHR
jgi:hypothetical protein